jgi:DNA-binding transcriptional MerR regulator
MRQHSTQDRGRLRTADVARETGYSVQQVRDLERLGVIPSAVRGVNGYRAYTATHVRALRAYRGLASAAGPVAARRLLADLFAGNTGLADAAAAVGAVHVRLARERDEALRARDALRMIQAEAIQAEAAGSGAAGRTAPASLRPASTDADADAMTITELATALGVRTSTLRFWEQEGLAVPERVTTLRARRYGTGAIREARIVAALRGSGYGIPAVRDVVATLRQVDGLAEGLAAAERILGRRLDQIADRTVALLRAGADLAAVLGSAPRATSDPTDLGSGRART